MTEHSNREHKELDNDAIRGGNRIGDFFRAIGGAIEHAVEWVGRAIFGALQGPGNLRGPFGPAQPPL